MNINKKIIQYLDFKKVSQREFTLKCKMSEGVLRRGKNIGSGYLLLVKTNYPDLSMKWLLFNEGDMLLPEDNNLTNEIEYCSKCESLTNELNIFKDLVASKNEMIALQKSQIGLLGDDKSSSKAS